ncbi:MAG: hypothetical protein R3B54_02365 [Bdellovibrionota bacterium]
MREKIKSWLKALKKEHDLFPYLHNMRKKEFDPAKDTVLYGGPFWNEEEVVAAIESLLAGKWLASGEAVSRFEAEFSKVVEAKNQS